MSWFVKARRAASVDDYETWQPGGVCPTLNAFDNATETRATVVAVAHAFYSTGGGHGLNSQPEISPPIKVGSALGIPSPPAVAHAAQVRRLVPVECERLQSFPDNWTAGQADTHRYKQMGNAVTVNVAHYIAELINSAVKEQP